VADKVVLGKVFSKDLCSLAIIITKVLHIHSSSDTDAESSLVATVPKAYLEIFRNKKNL
jgi:hypothetical protein